MEDHLFRRGDDRIETRRSSACLSTIWISPNGRFSSGVRRGTASSKLRSRSRAPHPFPCRISLRRILSAFLKSWTPNEQRLLFANRAGRPHSANKVVLDKLVIPRCGMHAFRHSLGIALSSTGASVKTIQTQLRHASSAVTLEKYVHPISQEQREAVEKAVGHLRTDVAKPEVNTAIIN